MFGILLYIALIVSVISIVTKLSGPDLASPTVPRSLKAGF